MRCAALLLTLLIAVATHAETRSAASAATFVKRLAALTERLASRNVVVAQLESHWGSFGSWRMEVQDGAAADRYADALKKGNRTTPGPDVVRFSWDGKDSILTIDVSPTRPLLAPYQWKREEEKELESIDAAVQFVEKYTAARFAR